MANINCKIKLNDDIEREFNSVEELNSFLRDNKKDLVSYTLTKVKKFSKLKNTPQQTEALVRARNEGMHLRESDHVYYRILEGGAREEGFTSTTQWISKEQALGSPDKPKEFMVPNFRESEYLQDLTNELLDAGLTEESVAKIIEDKKKYFDTASVSGTSFHNIAENFVLKNYTDAAAIKADYPTLTDTQAQSYFDAMTAIIDEIKKAHGDNAILIPEFIIVDDEKKITGSIDLLVIDNKGVMHIYDYKTSFKDVGDWNQVKRNAVDYQLTTYKQILLRQGFDVGKTKYIPIKIDAYNADTNTVEEFRLQQMMDSTQTSRGDVVYKINYLLPYEFKPKTDFLEDNKAISEVLLKNFNYEIKNALANKAAANNTAKQ